MIAAILTWWLQQLASLLPGRSRDPGARQPDALIVLGGALGGPQAGADLLDRRRRRERRLGTLGAVPLPQTRRCVLRLTGRPLQREVTLPTAVEGEIATLLAHDIGRLAPFGPAEIVWNWRISRRDAARQRLTVRLWYVPRKTLLPILTHLAGFQLAPGELEIIDPTGAVLRLDLRTAPPPRSRARRALAPVAAAGAALALVAAVATPFALQSRALSVLDDQRAALAPRAQLVDALRQRLTAREPGAVARAAETRRLGDALQTLAAVTNALPDDTVLTDFSYRERRLAIAGASGEAASLIAALSADPALHDPAFVAPIVHDPATGRDSFALRAQVTP